jgi:hypothetical protein
MGRETDTRRVPGGGYDRVIECPVCSNVMTKMEAEGVRVDVCPRGHLGVLSTTRAFCLIQGLRRP